VMQPSVGTPFVYGALTSGLRLDRSLALGATLRASVDTVPRSSTRWTWDLGGQWRPARWVALGTTLEHLGAPTHTASSLRTGIAVRPFTEWVTLGTDVRLTPGTDQVF